MRAANAPCWLLDIAFLASRCAVYRDVYPRALLLLLQCLCLFLDLLTAS